MMVESSDTPPEAGPETFRVFATRLTTILLQEAEVALVFDYSAIEYLDGFIERQKKRISKPEGIINMIGAFLGECLIANFGGVWKEDQELGWGIQFELGVTAFPFNKVRKRFGPDGEYDSIVSFFRAIPVLLEQARKKKFDKSSEGK